MAEWLKAQDWKSCIPRKGYRGFESLSLHHPTPSPVGLMASSLRPGGYGGQDGWRAILCLIRLRRMVFLVGR